jgi:hypothetical protein
MDGNFVEQFGMIAERNSDFQAGGVEYRLVPLSERVGGDTPAIQLVLDMLDERIEDRILHECLTA